MKNRINVQHENLAPTLRLKFNYYKNFKVNDLPHNGRVCFTAEGY